MKPISIRGYRIILKPSMVMIIVAILFGISSVFLLGAYPRVVNKPPSYGLLAPTTWKFESRTPAVAEAVAISLYDTNGGVDTAKSKEHSQYRLDMDTGVTANIKEVGPTPDYIYLRNGLNLDQLRQQNTATLTFEAKSDDPFPILLTIRENKNLLWRQGTTISGDWKPYRMTIPSDNVSQASKMYVIFSIQVGAHKGNISLRNIKLM